MCSNDSHLGSAEAVSPAPCVLQDDLFQTDADTWRVDRSSHSSFNNVSLWSECSNRDSNISTGMLHEFLGHLLITKLGLLFSKYN